MSVEKYANKANLERFKSKYDDEIDGKISAQGVPSGGTTGQVLTKNSNGYGWDNVPTELPSSSSSDEGKVLTVNSSGNPAWASASGGPTVYGSDVIHGGIEIFVESEYDTTVSNIVYFVRATYINISSTGKSVTEATEDDLVICNKANSSFPIGIYVVDHYGTVHGYSSTFNALILKCEQYMPVSLSRYVPPTVREVPSGGSTGQILTKKSSGYGWANAPTELPSSASGDAGKVLTVGSTGTPEWDTPSGGGSVEKIDLDKNIALSTMVVDKTWNGLTDFNGDRVWTDGEHIYYSSGNTQYILDKSTYTWSVKTWNGLTNFNGDCVWTDGTNIYYSYGSTTQYVLNKETSTWSSKTWTGLSDFYGSYIWTNGEDIYYSDGSKQYWLSDKSTSTWSTKSWNGSLSSFYGSNIWTDGTTIYYSYGTTQHVYNKSTNRWVSKTWSGLTNFYGQYIWTDGEHIYYSSSTTQYVLNGSTWSTQSWNNNTSFSGQFIWTDGEHIYYSSGSTQYEVVKKLASATLKPEITAKDQSKNVPSSTSSDSGKVLTVNSSGTPEWKTASGGLPSYSSSQKNKVLAVNYNGSSLWWRQLYCGTFVLGRNNYVNNYINNPEGATINYFEVMITATFSERNDTYSPLRDVTINISNYCYNDDHALKIMLPTQTDLCQLLINNKILPGGSGSDWIISSPQIRAYCGYFDD